MTPDQVEMVRQMLAQLTPPLNRTQELVENGFREVVVTLAEVLSGLPTCHCGKLAVSFHPPAYLCAAHAAREGTGGFILADQGALERAEEVLRRWSPKATSAPKPVQWTGRCPECQMILSAPVSATGPDAVATVECGREHQLTLVDGRHVLLDENGIPRHELPTPFAPTKPMTREELSRAPTRFVPKPPR